MYLSFGLFLTTDTLVADASNSFHSFTTFMISNPVRVEYTTYKLPILASAAGGLDHKGHYDVATVSLSLVKDAFPKQAAASKFHPSFDGSTGTPFESRSWQEQGTYGSTFARGIASAPGHSGPQSHGGPQGVKRKA